MKENLILSINARNSRATVGQICMIMSKELVAGFLAEVIARRWLGQIVDVAVLWRPVSLQQLRWLEQQNNVEDVSTPEVP